MRSYFDALDDRKKELEAGSPGWQVWYVPRVGKGVTWCARRVPQLETASADELAELMREAMNEQPLRRGVFDLDEDRALDALMLAWGDAYEVYITGSQWQAWRKDAADEDVLTASTPDELNRAIREDWSRQGEPQ